MARLKPVVLGLLLAASAAMLAGCESFDMDKLDVFGLSEKKKLPGERRPLFPEGVPGVTQGVPPELVKGRQPPPAADVAVAEPAKPAAEKPKPKAQAKPRVATKPTRLIVGPEANAPAAAPAPATNSQQGGTNAPWPSTTAQQPQPSASPWPSSPQSGTFQR